MHKFLITILGILLFAFPALADASRDFSGLWYDPTHDGEGYVIEVVSENQAVVYWFTYDNEGQQRWFIGLGEIAGETIAVSELLMPVGAQFGAGFDPSDVEQQLVGSLTLQFSSGGAVAQYTVDNVTDSQNLVLLAAPRSLAAAPGLADCASGSWFDPSHNGEGYIVHLLDESSAVVLWFSFTPDGQQAWFISEVANIGDDSLSVSLLQTAGGRFGPDFDPDEVSFSEWGSLELSLSNCKTGLSEYSSVLTEFGSGGLNNLTKLTNMLRATGVADEPAIQSGLRQILDEQFSQQGNTGTAVAVVFGDGTAWTGAAGWDDPRIGLELSPDQTLGFASITKTHVAALILRLVDEGTISLNDTVADWLPPQNNITPSANLIHLLNHTSGIADYVNDSNLIGVIRSNPNAPWMPETLVQLFVKPAYYQPGQSSGYSNTNYLLLGQILEAASGQNLSGLLNDHIFDRNGLEATYMGGEEPDPDNVPTTWVDLDGDGTLDDFSALYTSPSHHSARWAAGGMYSNVEDIARWAHILFKGNVVSPESSERMRQFLAINGTAAVWTGYGLGVQRFLANGYELWGHSGSISGSNSLMVYSPLLDISIAVIDNDQGANHFGIIGAMLPLLEDVLNQ